MSKLIILGLIIAIFSSCNNDINPDYFNKLCQPNSKFRVDSSRANYVTNGNHAYLSLRPITVPSDTFFMRLEYSTDTTLRIFEYSFYKLKTSYKIYSFPVDINTGQILFDKSKDTLEKFVNNITKQNVDKDFINALEKTNIFDLYSSDRVKNYPTDWERNYIIQYSNRCRYNIVRFTDPFQNRGKFKEADNVATFFEYLKKEFNF